MANLRKLNADTNDEYQNPFAGDTDVIPGSGMPGGGIPLAFPLDPGAGDASGMPPSFLLPFDPGAGDARGMPRPSAHGRETPRDRQMGGSGGGPTVSPPRQPRAPTPMAGSAGPPPPTLQPFQPLGQPDMSSFVQASQGLYGSSGGLRGGGLGVPMDPTNDAEGGITALIEALMRGR